MSDAAEWRPALPPPKRAAGIPDAATWDDELWRWSVVSDGKERRWAMNGALLQERVGSSYVAYYADGTISAKHTRKDGQITHEAFYRDGSPWCFARYVDDPTKDEISPEQVLAEKLHAKDGTLLRDVETLIDGDGVIAHRDAGRFENLRTPEGRELRFFDNGALVLTILTNGTSEARALVPPDREVTIDASGITDTTRRIDIEGQLGGRLFGPTILSEPQPDAVKALMKEHPWASVVETRAPFANASVANFLTALGSSLPNVADLAVLGLGNMITSQEQLQAVVPVLKAIGNERALMRFGVNDAAPSKAAAPPPVGEYALGKVTLPSGILAIVDMGALAQWSHDAPHHADLSGSEWAKVARKKNDDYVDLVVTGPDATKALAQFVGQHGATDLFDVEKARLDKIREHFAHHTPGLDATLAIAPQRVGHGQRLRLLRDAGLAHADFSFAHVNVVGVFLPPHTRELDVVGKRDEDQRWAYVSLIVKPGAKTTREVVIERLSIEEARFLFADGEALAAWDHERTVDGLHDLVFWGGMERQMILATGAELAYAASDYFGWTDLPPGTTPPHFLSQLFQLADRNALTVEVRPHSSHHAILRECWASRDEAGTATIGGAKMCGLFSSVGDGVFPVFAEYDDVGDVCRVTVKITAAPEDTEDSEHEPHEH